MKGSPNRTGAGEPMSSHASPSVPDGTIALPGKAVPLETASETEPAPPPDVVTMAYRHASAAAAAGDPGPGGAEAAKDKGPAGAALEALATIDLAPAPPTDRTVAGDYHLQ